MTYIKLPEPHKTLAIALALLGAYSTMPVANGNPSAQAQSTIPEVSTTRTYLPISRLSRSDQAIVVQQPNDWSAVQVAQNSKPTENGSPDSRSRLGAGTFADQRPGAGTFETLPSGQGAPDPSSRPGAGSRGGHSCPLGNKTLTPLIPVSPKILSRGQDQTPENSPLDSSSGLTVAEHPIFWFYIPFPLTAQRPIEFVLEDDKGNEIYNTKFTTSGISAGIVGFELPSTAPALEVNKTYRWYFSVYCTPDRTDEPTVAEGLVKRVSINSTLRHQLEQAKPQQRFELYAKASLWHEAVTSLAELRRKNPDDVTLKNEWTTLLQAMNLEAIAKEPITSRLTLEQ